MEEKEEVQLPSSENLDVNEIFEGVKYEIDKQRKLLRQNDDLI